MRYIWTHIKAIIASYNGSLPLSHFLKNYFKQYPVLGSRDRKILSAMAYTWYRCSKGINQQGATEAGIKKCLQLCNSEWLGNDKLFAEVDDVDTSFDVNALFPFEMALSVGIRKEEWLGSILVQPDLFIRLRKDKEKMLDILRTNNIQFSAVTENCIGLPNGAKIEDMLPEDAYVVQDASSQQTGNFFAPKKGELWYDCCAGAGGKSLLLKDMEPSVKLTVSDRRESILHNLMQRFRLYRHTEPVSYIADVASSEQLKKAIGAQQFDNIICDAPCSGSGTWARTPEQLYFFDPAAFEQFPRLQQSIAINVSRYLKPGGRLLYITCSLFRRENEEVVAVITKDTGLELISAQMINGISHRADSMFVAELRKG